MPKIHIMNFHYATVLTLRFLWILQGFSKMCGPNSYYGFPLCHCSDIKVFQKSVSRIHIMNFHYVTVLTLRFLWILQGFSKMCGPNSYYKFPLCHCSDIKDFVDTWRFFKNVWAQFILWLSIMSLFWHRLFCGYFKVFRKCVGPNHNVYM